MTKLKTFTHGLVKENPIFVMLLALCPALGTTSSAVNGMGMGLATTFVLVCSNSAIASLKKFIPDQVRIPIFVIIIATFVSIVDLLIKGYVPVLADSLGLFIPLIVVNCVVFARAESFAAKNSVIDSMLDGLGMGLGFTLSLTLLGCVREFLGTGKIFNFAIFPEDYGILIFVLAPGAFFVLGYLIAIAKRIQRIKF